MLYSLDDTTDILGRASTTLYKLRQLSEEDLLMRGDKSLRMQTILISIIKEATEWEVENNFGDPETHMLAAYLNHKISGYNFDATAPYYALPATLEGQASGSGTARSGYQLFKQIVVGAVGSDDEIVATSTNYTNPNLIGRYVTVVLDGQILAVGLSDRQSYLYNMNTGSIEFTDQLGQGSVITIFTYIPTLAGWTKQADFTVVAPFSTYSIPVLIGKSVAIIVDDQIIPIDLPGMLSYTYSPLSGIIVFSQILSIGQNVQIYTY